MKQDGISLLDILSPPGNSWLAELCRRKADLPAGVRIVRFGADEDESQDVGGKQGGRRVVGGKHIKS